MFTQNTEDIVSEIRFGDQRKEVGTDKNINIHDHKFKYGMNQKYTKRDVTEEIILMIGL